MPAKVSQPGLIRPVLNMLLFRCLSYRLATRGTSRMSSPTIFFRRAFRCDRAQTNMVAFSTTILRTFVLKPFLAVFQPFFGNFRRFPLVFGPSPGFKNDLFLPYFTKLFFVFLVRLVLTPHSGHDHFFTFAFSSNFAPKMARQPRKERSG